MSNSTAKVFAYFPIVLNQDGTTKRLFEFPTLPSDPNPSSHSPVLSKDLPLNPLLNTSLRIFLPAAATNHRSPPLPNQSYLSLSTSTAVVSSPAAKPPPASTNSAWKWHSKLE
ncbi:Carboxylesterase 1 [Camellia lanceoleosa]|nr:Carboxylesterase 1 [Camellia lanceoleosa]